MRTTPDSRRGETGWGGTLLVSCLAHLLLLGGGIWLGAYFTIPFGGQHPGGAGGALVANLVSKVPGGSIPMPAPTLLNTQNRLANPMPDLTRTMPHRAPRPRRNAVRLPSPVHIPDLARRQALRELRHMQQADVRNRQHRRVMYGAGGPASFTYSMSGQGVGGGGGMAFGDATFGTLYTGYVNQLRNRLSFYWSQQYRDPTTPVGRAAYVAFTINRAGEISNIQFDRRTGIPALDGMALHAVEQMASSERLPLPANYPHSSLDVVVSFQLQ